MNKKAITNANITALTDLNNRIISAFIKLYKKIIMKYNK